MSSIQEEINFGNLRALVIDDEPVIVKIVAAALKELGIGQIQMAKDGLEAISFFHDEVCRFDLIICDWMMPNMNGLEFLKEFRAMFPKVPFLMLTGKVTKEAILDAKNAGVSAYIGKPFTTEQVHKKIRTLIIRSIKETSGETAWLATMGN